MNLGFKDNFDETWIDQIIYLHNKTELKRPFSNKEKLCRALRNRYAVITCWYRGSLVGIGSMLSDGEMYSSIFDVVVDPIFQGQGIGKEIMDKLMSKAPQTSVHLTSTHGNEDFYSKIGFRKHKTAFSKYNYESKYLI
jgi:ribosomal protein S18 acetylase RimI-like enzyme